MVHTDSHTSHVIHVLTLRLFLRGRKRVIPYRETTKLLEFLEDHDDVQNVFANLSFDDDAVSEAVS